MLLTTSSTGIVAAATARVDCQPLLNIPVDLEREVTRHAARCKSIKKWESEVTIPYRAIRPMLTYVLSKMSNELVENWDRNTERYTKSAFMCHLLTSLTSFDSMWDKDGFFPKTVEYLQSALTTTVTLRGSGLERESDEESDEDDD